MPRNRFFRRWGLLIAGLALPAAAEPSAEDLLRDALSSPGVSYSGEMETIRWFGKQTHAEEARVEFSPPNRYHWEFLSPAGGVEKVVVSDGVREEVRLVRRGRVLTGDAVKSSERLMGAQRELELLFRNYSVRELPTEKIAGRPAWVVELVPNAGGKPHQRMWIDRETRAVLATRRYQPKGGFVLLSRFLEFEPNPDLPEDAFKLQAATGSAVDEHGLDADSLSLEGLNRATGQKLSFPPALSDGFVFDSADFFRVRATQVYHLRYTDGLSMVSLFVTDRPVRSKGVEGAPAPTGPQNLTSTGQVLRLRSGRWHYTLVGDVSKELLDKIGRQLTEPLARR